MDSTAPIDGGKVDGAVVEPLTVVPTPAVMPPRRRIDPDDVPLPEELARAAAREREAAEREQAAKDERARAARERRARTRTDAPPAATAQPLPQLTAGQLAELLGDVQANTPVWQVADSEDERELIPVQFVEVLSVNGLVQRLVIK